MLSMDVPQGNPLTTDNYSMRRHGSIRKDVREDMKNMKKILALVVAVLMIVASMSALAETKITINRDASWDENAESANATYTYYKIFDAQIEDAAAVVAQTGALNGEGTVVYTISGTDAAAKVAALPTGMFNANLANDGKYYITLANASTSAADIVAALKTMVETAANATLFPGSAVTSNQNPVEITVPSDGYYLIVASNGKDLAVQTIGDVTINEKNDYPSIDKKQKKADGEYQDAELPVEIGKYIDYKVDVVVPADANKAIYVYDTMSRGLAFDDETNEDGLLVKEGENAVTYSAIADTDTTNYKNGATWQIVFDADTVIANRGKTITITYRALVTEDALVDTGKENEVELDYDNKNYILKDKVNYEFYTTGAVKYDGATADVDANNALIKDADAESIAYLQGAEFKLQVKVGKTGDWADLAVVANSDGTYRPAKTGETGVALTSDANGAIIIRGLDKDNDYQLIETKAPAGGYNLLSNAAALNVTTKDDKAKVGLKGSAADTTYLDNATVELSAKIENNKGSQLPSTGGMGTTILYVGGSILVILAAILLITKRRMNAED